MADQPICALNFVAKIKTRHIVVPPMLAEISLADPAEEVTQAFRRDRLLIQKIRADAMRQLERSAATVAGAIEDFDAKFKPSADLKDMEEQVQRFSDACQQIMTAQRGLAMKAAKDAWAGCVARKQDYVKLEIVFAVKLAVATITLAFAVVSAAATSVEASVALVAGLAKRRFDEAKQIFDVTKASGEYEDKILEYGKLLRKRHADPKIDWQAAPSAITAALGVPFAKGTSMLEDALNEHRKRIRQIRDDVGRARDDARNIETQIGRLAESVKPDKAALKKATELKLMAVTLKEQAEQLLALNAKALEFQNNHRATLDMLKLRRPAKFEVPAARVEGTLDTAIALGKTAKSLVDKVMVFG